MVAYHNLAMQHGGLLNLQGTPRNATVSGSSVSVAISALQSNSSRTRIYDPVIMAIDINIDAGSGFSYSVWIDYDRLARRLSAYVNVEGMPKPASTIAEAPFTISSIPPTNNQGRQTHDSLSNFYDFGLFSTVAQQLSVSRWNATVEDLPYYPEKGGFLSGKVTILSAVFGSVTATAVMATALACYFNSRYRRWNKDLDQLARSMERLPGVPTKVEFADIKKATGNFHETMKLGGGGFGTVYRCTLPATASKKERPMDVAVKRFTRDVQNHRYDDFLAEVSIINRLRHKNIVPLVGKSLNE
jgi:interleukin-1 receptor-associated kinase 1